MSTPNRRRENIFYIGMLLLGLVSVWGINFMSEQPDTLEGLTLGESLRLNFNTFLGFVGDHASSEFGLLLAQVLIILIAARAVAWIFMKIGQPTVIGEIIAGIILGPSVLGLLFPDLFRTIFPIESLPNISLLSQFGLILFMFVIGMELEISEIKKHLRKTLIISHTGIIVPFVLGALAAIPLFADYGVEGSTLLPFALFMGIAMSITAFPVLARIVQERGQMNSHIGMLSLSSAAAGDITAWCMIAVIMAIAQAGSAASALFTVLFAAIYVGVMFLVVRPIFKLVGKVFDNSEIVGKGVIAAIFLTLLLSSYVTEILGLHALFGAFMAGVIMPEDAKFRRILTDKVEDVSLSIFLPLFFVTSGLQTEIGLLNTPEHWLITLGLIILAVLGKLGGTYASARVVGESKHDSLIIGILMNTRGLMELIVLSMGYQLGILSPVIYAILVLMTLVTTVMTTPLLDFTKSIMRRRQSHGESGVEAAFHVLFSFGRTSTALIILRVIDTFFAKDREKYAVTAMHMTVGSDISPVQAEHFRTSNFKSVSEYAEKREWKVNELYEVTDDPTESIIEATSQESVDLLMVGAGVDLSHLPKDVEINRMRSRFRGRFGLAFAGASSLFALNQLMQDKSEVFVRRADCSVGIVIDRGLDRPAESILVVHDPDSSDISKYISLVKLLLSGAKSKCECLDLGDDITDPTSKSGTLYGIPTLMGHDLTELVLKEYDLLLIPYDTWKRLIAQDPSLLTRIPTTILLASKLRSKEVAALHH